MLIASSINALVIDDNDHGRALTEKSLNQLGVAKIYTASDAIAGFEILSSNSVDVVFLDWYMPEINGAGFVRLARSGFAGFRKDVPIIITTAYSTRENTTRIVSLELKEVLIKPFTSKQLNAALSLAFSNLAPKIQPDDVPEDADQYLL